MTNSSPMQNWDSTIQFQDVIKGDEHDEDIETEKICQ